MTAPELAGRDGFDENFLGVSTPLPVLPGVETVVLRYTHFSTVHRRDRGFAAATAVAIEGAELRDVGRDDDWNLDPRLPDADQVGNEVYANNDLDRGHLVRRLDPVWGPPEVAAAANADTFFFTNAAPQAAQFNQDRLLWLGLEDYLLDHAGDFDRKLVVLTGPVFADDDPVYREVALPLMFWKVAAFLQGGELASTGYLLDQTPQIDDLALVRQPGSAPPLGPFRTFQVAVEEIVGLTGLELGPLPGDDQQRTAAVPAPGSPPTASRRHLSAYTDIVLGPHTAS